jgi:hypothetical protein
VLLSAIGSDNKCKDIQRERIKSPRIKSAFKESREKKEEKNLTVNK